MVPFFVLLTLFLFFTVFRFFHIPGFSEVGICLRLVLSGMFLLTALAHWGRRRPDLIRMVSLSLPHRDVMVTVTGGLELLGAVGLLLPTVARWAGLGLSILLLVMFPANLHAARKRLTMGGQPVLALVPRTILQVVFLAATLAVFCRLVLKDQRE